MAFLELAVTILHDGRSTKWLSSDKAPSAGDFDLKDLAVEGTLGFQWNLETDDFNLRIVHEAICKGILSYISAMYEPLGLAVTMILPAKSFLQSLCKLN